jgi:hypothetical protein
MPQLQPTSARGSLYRRHHLEHETSRCRIQHSLEGKDRLTGSHVRSWPQADRLELASFLAGMRWNTCRRGVRNRKASRCEASLHLQTLAHVDTLSCLSKPLFRRPPWYLMDCMRQCSPSRPPWPLPRSCLIQGSTVPVVDRPSYTTATVMQYDNTDGHIKTTSSKRQCEHHWMAAATGTSISGHQVIDTWPARKAPSTSWL